MKGLDILREMRALRIAQDGRNDYEEAGIEEANADFERMDEDEMMLVEQ